KTGASDAVLASPVSGVRWTPPESRYRTRSGRDDAPYNRLSQGYFFPYTKTTNVSGKIAGRGCGLSSVAAGAGPNSAVTRNTWCVSRSSVIVRAPRCVGTFSTTINFSGESSCTTVIVALCPFDANAYNVPESNAFASTPSPISGVAITFPVSASTTAIILLSQPAKSLRFTRSIASPDGDSHGASFHVAVTLNLSASIRTISLL